MALVLSLPPFSLRFVEIQPEAYYDGLNTKGHPKKYFGEQVIREQPDPTKMQDTRQLNHNSA